MAEDKNKVPVSAETLEGTEAVVDIEKIKAEVIAEAKAAAQAEIDELMKEAKAEADEIIAEAKAKTEVAAATTKAETAQASGVKTDPYWEELVDVHLIKDNNKYKDDVYVAVNGENCIIQRGKPVKIKRKFADVLKNSMEQDSATADLMRSLEASFEEKSEELT